MATQFRCLVNDYSTYQKAFSLFLERSSEHQSMRDFIQGIVPTILEGVGGGRSSVNVMAVGSGPGEMDLDLLAQLHLKHPAARVEKEVVEPSGDMVYKYKVLISNTPGLDHVTFRWNKMTASEFESDWKRRKPEKKMDFIHMIQMLYYVENPEATVAFFRSLLDKDGKLLIILVSGESGWRGLWRTYRAELGKGTLSQSITTRDIRSFLDAKGIPYQSYRLASELDITECFRAGDEKGELLLDFLTEVLEFSKSAPPQLRAGVLELLKHPDCSREMDGRILFNSDMEALVLGP